MGFLICVLLAYPLRRLFSFLLPLDIQNGHGEKKAFPGATFVLLHASTFSLGQMFFVSVFVSVPKQMLRGKMIFSTPRPRSRDLNA